MEKSQGNQTSLSSIPVHPELQSDPTDSQQQQVENLQQPHQALPNAGETIKTSPKTTFSTLKSSKTLLDKALRLCKQGRLKEAIKCFEEEISQKNNQFCLCQIKLRNQFESKGISESLEVLEEAITLNLEIIVTFFLLGICFYELQSLSQVKAYFQQCVQKIGYGSVLYSVKGEFLLSLGKFAEASQSYEKLFSLSPSNFDAKTYCNQAFCLFSLGKVSEALENYEKAISLEPNNAGFSLAKGTCLSELRKFNEALIAYEKVLSLEPDNIKAHAFKSVCLHKLKRFPEALQSCEKAIDLAPQNVDYRLIKGSCLLEYGKLDEALDSFKEAVSLDPKSAKAHFHYAEYLFFLEKSQEALESLEEVFLLAPDDAKAYALKGDCLNRLKDTKGALICYEKALYLEQNNEVVYTGRRNDLVFRRAVESYRTAIPQKIKNPKLLSSKGECLASLGKFDEALKDFDEALSLDQKNAKRHFHKGNCLLSAQQFGDALECFESAISLVGSSPFFQYYKALALEKLGRAQEALDILDQLIRTAPSLKAFQAALNFNAIGEYDINLTVLVEEVHLLLKAPDGWVLDNDGAAKRFFEFYFILANNTSMSVPSGNEDPFSGYLQKEENSDNLPLLKDKNVSADHTHSNGYSNFNMNSIKQENSLEETVPIQKDVFEINYNHEAIEFSNQINVCPQENMGTKSSGNYTGQTENSQDEP